MADCSLFTSFNQNMILFFSNIIRKELYENKNSLRKTIDLLFTSQ